MAKRISVKRKRRGAAERTVINNPKHRESKIGICVNSMWRFVAEYLDMLNYTCARCDKGFANRYRQLTDYVYSKIAVPKNEQIIDEYALFEMKKSDGLLKRKKYARYDILRLLE